MRASNCLFTGNVCGNTMLLELLNLTSISSAGGVTLPAAPAPHQRSHAAFEAKACHTWRAAAAWTCADQKQQ